MAGKTNKEGITITFDAETVKFDNSVANMDKMMKVLKKEAQELKDQMKFEINEDKVNRSLENTQSQIKVLNEILKQSKEKLQECTEEVEENGEMVTKITDMNKYTQVNNRILDTNHLLEKLYDKQERLLKLKEDMEEIPQWVHDYSEKAKEAAERTEELSKKFEGMSKGAQKVLGDITDSAAEFESAMAGVRKTVDATEEEYGVMGEAFRDMSKDLPITATEIANIAENAGQLGIEKDNIVAFTNAMAKLGMSTNLSSTDAATNIARIFNITGADLENVDNFAAALVELGNNSATTESEILDMATRLAGSASIVGMNEQEILGLSAALSSVGLKAEQGGSAISRTITEIDKDVANAQKGATDGLEDWAKVAGMTAKEFADAWESDAASALVSVITGLDNAKDAGENLNIKLDELGINAIRQTDAMKRIANNSELLTNAMEMSNRAFDENTALEVEASKRNETYESRVQMLKNTINDLAIELGETLLPILKRVVDFAKVVVDRFTNMPQWMQTLTLGILGVIAVLAPLLSFVSKISNLIGDLPKILLNIKSVWGKIAPLFTNGWKLILGIVGKVKTGISLLWGVIMANPVVAIVVGVVALVAALTTLYAKCDSFRTWMQTNMPFISKLLDGLIDGVKKVIGWFNKLFGKAEALSPTIQDVEKAYDNRRFNIDSSGFGLNLPSLSGIQSSGYGTLSLATTIQVNNNGTPIDTETIRSWGETITNIVSENLGRRLA